MICCNNIAYLLLIVAWLAFVGCLAEPLGDGLSSGEVTAIKPPRPMGANLPDLASSTNDEPIVAVVGQDAYISCIANNLQNYTIIWRFTNDAHAPGLLAADSASSSAPSSSSAAGLGAGQNQKDSSDSESDLGTIISAGRQRVSSDERFSVIRSHNTWLLRINNVRLSDTGTYICQTNSEPKVRVIRILSVLKSASAAQDQSTARLKSEAGSETADAWLRGHYFDDVNHNFTECCRNEFVFPRCQRLCTLEQLASRYDSINIVHECYSTLPSITRCMVAGRNVTDCCQRRHIPSRCHAICGHSIDRISSMSIQDQSYCADYSASIMSCVAEGISSLPGQPEFVIVEAISSTTLKVSWQKVADESELAKIDGWIINLTKLSSFDDTISAAGSSRASTSSKGPHKNTDDSNDDNSNPATSTNPNGANQPTQQQASVVANGPKPATAWPTSSNSLANLSIVDVMQNSSLASMTRLLAASNATISLKLDKQVNEFSIDNLKPFTVYQIQMFAFNSLGRSQLTDPIRALTLAPDNELSKSDTRHISNSDDLVEPDLPDTRKCCEKRGVTLKKCVDTLCDPVEADKATIEDLMICAPWSNVTFSCLASQADHSECCKARGVSPFCLSICSGEMKKLDYRHFRCLTHMSTYTNCILESHDVLPGAPHNFTVGPITSSWAVLNWRPPSRRASTLQGYRIFWRRVEPTASSAASAAEPARAAYSSLTETSSAASASLATAVASSAPFTDDSYYSSAEAATNPYLLDALQADTVYETFVVAVNKYGQSKPSVRFLFQTLTDPANLDSTQSEHGQPDASRDLESRLPLHAHTRHHSDRVYYNETNCCVSSGVTPSCEQICDYDLKVADAYGLITSCNTQMPTIMRCLAGSRNSVPCCRNRGVSDQCLNVCAGLTEHSPLLVATQCGPDFGKILQCLDEGSKQIPGAPTDLHTVDIKSDQVTVRWAPANEDKLRNDIQYHVRYQELQSNLSESGDQPSLSDLSALIAVVPLHPLEHNHIMSVNKSEASIAKLRPATRYSIYVTAENSYGISLPSLVLVIQTPATDDATTDEYRRHATLGAPHSLEILRSDTESMVLRWSAPLYVEKDANIRYRIFYKPMGLMTADSLADSGPTGDESGRTRLVSANWTVIETSDTSILLKGLAYSTQYAITVQAFSKNLRGHMSEILLAATAKPVPPTINPPLIINQPIEGNNITIMCVALGSPTPQISMFINGLLVQKRTQPYVVYHLVNLVRGQLTVTCFASNGRGKDYASVQSRTELMIKFRPKAAAKVREIWANSQSMARLGCQVAGNPQPTVVWSFVPTNGTGQVIVPNERISTLIVSQFDTPSSWSHTLTVRNVTNSDSGSYQCRAINALGDSSDTVSLLVNEPSSRLVGQSGLRLDQASDLAECCRSQNVSSKCLPVCSPDGLDIERAFRTPDCQSHLDKLMFCAADGSDHRNCCRQRQVPFSCLRWCSGAKLNIPSVCLLSSAVDINQCFQEGRGQLPGPPRNVRAKLAADVDYIEPGSSASSVGGDVRTSTTTMQVPFVMGSAPDVASSTPSVLGSMAMAYGDSMSGQASGADAASQPSTTKNASSPPEESESIQQQSEPIVIEWDPPTKNPQLVQYYRVFWRPFGTRELSRTITNQTWIKLNDLKLDRIYEFVVKAANAHGSSVYSEPLAVKPSEVLASSKSLSLIWFIPAASSNSFLGRIGLAITFASCFMLSSLMLVLFLERRGLLQRFASSKSNNSRISFANPSYLKDSAPDDDDDAPRNNGQSDGFENIVWDQNDGHSLQVLGMPAPSGERPQQQDPKQNEPNTNISNPNYETR